MANELKFGNKVVFLGGTPLTLPVAASDPGAAVNGDMYYNSTDDVVKVYQGGSWSSLATGGAAANTALSNLAAVAINASLLPGTTGSIDLGSGSKIWRYGFVNELRDSGGIVQVDLLNRNLNASDASVAVNWESRELVDDAADPQLAWSAAGVSLPQLTLSTVPYIDASNVLVSSAVTPTELGYLSGVTSAIQTQLGARALDADVIKKNGSVAFTAAQSMGGFNLTNVADPTTAQMAATKAYVDAVASGLRPKAAVRTATLVAGTLATSFENGDVIDGVTLVTGNRILIKNQAAPEENGIYIVAASGAPARAPDFDSLSPIDEINGAYTFVQEGTQAGQGWVQTGTVTTIGTDPINFVYFNDAATVVGGDMISVTGSTISVDLATVSGLESTNPGNNAGQLRVKLEASNPSLMITGSNELGAKLNAAGAITSGASGLIVGVDNSTIEISTNALRVKALGISDGHISASAAIALTKLAALNNNIVPITSGSGFLTSSAVTATELGYLTGVTSAIQTQLGGKASTALSNLASVAINTTLVSDTDNTDDLGTDAIEWKDAWVYNIKHNSSGTPTLGISTTGNNGSINLNANGTGNLDIQATKMRRSENGASSNYMEEQYFDALALANNISSATAISSLSFAYASFTGVVVEYMIKEATSAKVRIGRLIVSTDGSVVSASDQFSETAVLGSALGLSLDAAINGANVEIRYNNTHATNACTVRCLVRRIRA